jgi:ribosomal protein S18 acetylase RimI-like enzyme
VVGTDTIMHDGGTGHGDVDTVILRDAGVREAEALTELAMRSKAVWGYSHEFMERCRPLLIVTAGYIAANPVIVAVSDDEVAGFYSLVDEGDHLSLDLCYVDPSMRGRGIGRRLVEDAVRRSRAAARTLVVESDPNAEGFYRSLGAQRTGSRESPAEAGRMLPVLTFTAAAQ